MIKGMKSFSPEKVGRDASMSWGDCGEVCVGMSAIIICGKRWLLRMALFSIKSSRNVSPGTHRVFGSTLGVIRKCAKPAWNQANREWLPPCHREECCLRAAEVKQQWQT
jgi:hypothetical protein